MTTFLDKSYKLKILLKRFNLSESINRTAINIYISTFVKSSSGVGVAVGLGIVGE
jgi:hypothetical protein